MFPNGDVYEGQWGKSGANG